jgi:hypothetical protein
MSQRKLECVKALELQIQEATTCTHRGAWFDSYFFGIYNMTASTKLFPSTPCETSYIDYMREEGDTNGYMTPPLEHCGYSVIANHLVPEIFIQRVIEQMHGGNYEYGLVLSKDDIFGVEFLSSLGAQEHEVLMLVVLEAVARGDFEMHLWTNPTAEDECEDEAS